MPMATNQEKKCEKLCRNSTVPSSDFSKIGGLSNHLKILRDIIIVPLLHSNVYTHFNIKTPKGVLFYGPPGTGKTLVAGALANELSKEGVGKVSFFQRKGADVLDKWVGESEKKLRGLFEIATRKRPSIIFFDELDGLAPVRSSRNDQIHCSIVTTLLALMDGLDSVPGVVIIGATNRIESVDPALRRAGRFDRELYFPMPSTEARKEILQVHTHGWDRKPSPQFLSYLAEVTPGFCGSDLQALCAESVLCCMKRNYPNVERINLLKSHIKINADEMEIDECDFLSARRNLFPSSQKLGNRMRKLSPAVKPLLQRQLDTVLTQIKVTWPHFYVQFHKYLLGSERYIGRIVLVGSNVQGLNTHLIPAILQSFEHLPSYFVEIAPLDKNVENARQTLPSILVLPRVDELWNVIESAEQIALITALESVHAGLPLLIIATCDEKLPPTLQNFFYNNVSAIITIDNPTELEIKDFLAPLFFGEQSNSLIGVLSHVKHHTCQSSAKKQSSDQSCKKSKATRKTKSSPGKIVKPSSKSKPDLKSVFKKVIEKDMASKSRSQDLTTGCNSSECSFCGTGTKHKRMSLILTELLKRSLRYILRRKQLNEAECISNRSRNYFHSFGESSDADKQKIYQLWKRASTVTAKDLPVSRLELMYDSISACIGIHKHDFNNLTKHLENTLGDIEASK